MKSEALTAALNSPSGREVFLKLDNLQPAGRFTSSSIVLGVRETSWGESICLLSSGLCFTYFSNEKCFIQLQDRYWWDHADLCLQIFALYIHNKYLLKWEMFTNICHIQLQDPWYWWDDAEEQRQKLCGKQWWQCRWVVFVSMFECVFILVFVFGKLWWQCR